MHILKTDFILRLFDSLVYITTNNRTKNAHYKLLLQLIASSWIELILYNFLCIPSIFFPFIIWVVFL